MADPKNRPPLDELIDAAAKLPPGPEAWEPIFRHYPELNIEEIEQAFSDVPSAPGANGTNCTGGSARTASPSQRRPSPRSTSNPRGTWSPHGMPG
jgi:hypothetical protein